MAALGNGYTNVSGDIVIYRRDDYVSGTGTYTNYPRYRHVSRAEQELQEFLADAEEDAWQRRLQDEARERQVLLDARSRRQRVHPKTKQQAGRRMQTYDAAMAMRQLRR